MAAIAYRRRALPVCWQVRRRTGVSDADQQKSLLAKLSKRIEEACEARSEAEVPEAEAPEVIVIGDGSFHSTELMSYLSDKGWFYRLRLHSDSYVRLSKEGSWKQLGDLAPEEGGEYRYLNGVYVTKTDPYGPVSIAICHADGEEDPWFIATSEQEADYLTLRTYSRRMWIEELFGDLQASGFQLQKSGLYEPARLSRLAGGSFLDVRVADECGRVGYKKRIPQACRAHRPPRPELRGDWTTLHSTMYDQRKTLACQYQTLLPKTVR